MAKPKPSENEIAIRDLYWNYEKNSKRVANLIELYENKLHDGKQGRPSAISQDVFRAACVLLHAALEDMLRQARITFFPFDDPKKLDLIGLPGDGKKRPESFKLGALKDFEGLEVADLIRNCVESHFENFGSISRLNDIMGCLADCRIEDIEFDKNELARMISRRHKIVHKGDADREAKGQGNHKISPINVNDVKSFKKATDDFVNKFVDSLRAKYP